MENNLLGVHYYSIVLLIRPSYTLIPIPMCLDDRLPTKLHADMCRLHTK